METQQRRVVFVSPATVTLQAQKVNTVIWEQGSASVCQVSAEDVAIFVLTLSKAYRGESVFVSAFSLCYMISSNLNT